jgi:broad specificity phosphatase PhoE
MRRGLLGSCLLILLGAAPAATARDFQVRAWLADAQEDVVVYLVRHAERAEDGTDDPPISEAGVERARLLAEMLKDAGITHIHCTDYKRTLQTAAPLSEASGLEVAFYDLRDLDGFAARLRATPGRHLVLGHTNTTPDLVQTLGGDPGEPIAEFEHDRLYVVVVDVDDVSTILLRFGAPFSG